MLSKRSRKIRHNGWSFPWHRWLLYSFENTIKTKCGFQGSNPYWDWRIGKPHNFSDENNEHCTDAPDFHNSPFFKDSDPESGLGGWGDPNSDFQVQDGGFSVHSTFRLSYPSPHPLRRNFTLQPYLNVGPPNAQFIQNPTLDANVSLSYSAIDSMINGFVGDYKGLQTAVEGWQGPYVYGHLILGELFQNLRISVSHRCLAGGDLAGHCPANAPPSCATSPGPTINGNSYLG